MSLDTKFLLVEISKLFDAQEAKWDVLFSRRDARLDASDGVEPPTASTSTSITTPVAGHDASPAVAEETALHAVPGANYMEVPTTCSTPGLTEHATAEAAHRRALRVPRREPLPRPLCAFPAHERLDLSACASLDDASFAAANGVGWRGLEVLVAVCPKLAAVDLSHCASAGNREVAALAGASGLRDWRLNAYVWFDEAANERKEDEAALDCMRDGSPEAKHCTSVEVKKGDLVRPDGNCSTVEFNVVEHGVEVASDDPQRLKHVETSNAADQSEDSGFKIDEEGLFKPVLVSGDVAEDQTGVKTEVAVSDVAVQKKNVEDKQDGMIKATSLPTTALEAEGQFGADAELEDLKCILNDLSVVEPEELESPVVEDKHSRRLSCTGVTDSYKSAKRKGGSHSMDRPAAVSWTYCSAPPPQAAASWPLLNGRPELLFSQLCSCPDSWCQSCCPSSVKDALLGCSGIGAHCVFYLLKVYAPATKLPDWIGCTQSQKLRSYGGNILGLRPIPWPSFILVEFPTMRYFCMLTELPWAVLAYQCCSSLFVGVEFLKHMMMGYMSVVQLNPWPSFWAGASVFTASQGKLTARRGFICVPIGVFDFLEFMMVLSMRQHRYDGNSSSRVEKREISTITDAAIMLFEETKGDLLNALALTGQTDQVYAIVSDMSAAGLGLNKFGYVGLVTAFKNKTPTIGETIGKMISSNFFLTAKMANTPSLSSGVDLLCISTKFQRALKGFEVMSVQPPLVLDPWPAIVLGIKPGLPPQQHCNILLSDIIQLCFCIGPSFSSTWIDVPIIVYTISGLGASRISSGGECQHTAMWVLDRLANGSPQLQNRELYRRRGWKKISESLYCSSSSSL